MTNLGMLLFQVTLTALLAYVQEAEFHSIWWLLTFINHTVRKHRINKIITEIMIEHNRDI